MIDLIVRYRYTTLWVAYLVYCAAVFHVLGLVR